MRGSRLRAMLASYNRYQVLPPPMAGGSPEGDDGKGAGDGDKSKPGSPPAGKGDDDDQDGDGNGGDKGDGGRGDLNKALAEERRQRKAVEAKLAERDAAEAEAQRIAAEKAGEFQKLYDAEKGKHGETRAALEAKVATLEAELRHRDVERALADYLGDKHPGHLAKARWMRPALMAELQPDMDEAAIQAVVKRVADDYVKDNPAGGGSQGGSGGAPGASGKGGGQTPPKDPLANFGSLKGFIDHATGADLVAK